MRTTVAKRGKDVHGQRWATIGTAPGAGTISRFPVPIKSKNAVEEWGAARAALGDFMAVW